MSARSIPVTLALQSQRMTAGFTAHGLRSGGPIAMDPFLNIDEFVMSEPTFPPHPHAGFSAVTYMFEDSEGAFVNRDSLGDRSRIEPGALHWTQAARGMMHEEIPERPGTPCHGLQMFVNLREADKNAAPRAFHVAAKEIPEVLPDPGVRVRVLAGAFRGVASPLDGLLTRVQLLDARLEEGARLEVRADATQTAFALVVQGSGRAGEGPGAAEVTTRTAVGFADDGDRLHFLGGRGGLQVLVCVGTPIREPVVFGGPFAMTHAAALRDAEARYRRGEMGRLLPST